MCDDRAKKEFRDAGICVPGRHYMVDMGDRIQSMIRTLIRPGKYFTISSARQYGKTTMLYLLERQLQPEYIVISLSFEGRDDYFSSIGNFAAKFSGRIRSFLAQEGLLELSEIWRVDKEELSSNDLDERITRCCSVSSKPVVLMIDEADRAADYDVFLFFLGLLRDKYIERDKRGTPTFHSVILAGVRDIRNLKGKDRPEYSPWNIAADFLVDMNFTIDDIAGMLLDYEKDHRTGMDIRSVSERIHFHTNGYPFLVSRLCKLIGDNSLGWTPEGVDEAEKALLESGCILFDALIRNVGNNPSLEEMLRAMLLNGRSFLWERYSPELSLGSACGILREENRKAAVSNVTFETRLCSWFASMEEMRHPT